MHCIGVDRGSLASPQTPKVHLSTLPKRARCRCTGPSTCSWPLAALGTHRSLCPTALPFCQLGWIVLQNLWILLVPLMTELVDSPSRLDDTGSLFCEFFTLWPDLGPDVRQSVSRRPYVDLTLADEDTNSILTDNAKRAIQGKLATQVTQPGGQLCKQCKWRHLMTNCWTNPSCATWWPNLQLIQVVPSGGQIYN